jgi:hypothetical protein
MEEQEILVKAIGNLIEKGEILLDIAGAKAAIDSISVHPDVFLSSKSSPKEKEVLSIVFPYLKQKSNPFWKPEFSGKILLVLELLEELRSQQRTVAVLTKHRHLMDALQAMLKDRNVPCHIDKREFMTIGQSADSSADSIIVLDDLDRATEDISLMALRRSKRGQVTVYRIVSEGTFDELDVQKVENMRLKKAGKAECSFSLPFSNNMAMLEAIKDLKHATINVLRRPHLSAGSRCDKPLAYQILLDANVANVTYDNLKYIISEEFYFR